MTCMCASSAFQADVLACLNANCTATDLAQAKSLDAEFCTSCACHRFFFSRSLLAPPILRRKARALTDGFALNSLSLRLGGRRLGAFDFSGGEHGI